MPVKILMIGLDAADPGLLDRWCDEGSLPNMKMLHAQGRVGRLSSPIGLGDDAVWPSFYTGEHVGSHGRYFWEQLAADAGRPTLSRDRLPIGQPFWSRLSAAGKRVAVIDVPKCPVSRRLNGIHLCDWLVHGLDYPQPTSYPADLAARIVAEFGSVLPAPWEGISCRLDEQSIEDMRRALCRSAAMKSSAVRRYMKGADWDVMVAVFKEAHSASHMLWHLVDPGHPDHRAGVDEWLGQPLRSVYQALDRAVGALIDAAGPQASLLLFTTMGMSANFTGNHLMEPVAACINRRYRAGLNGKSRIGSSFIQAIRPIRGLRRLREPHALCRILPHNEASGALRLNVAGRDPGGVVQPGAEYDDLCERLADLFGDLRDSETGRNVVATVVKVSEAFAGPAAGLPDLFIVWDRTAPIRSVISPSFGLIASAPEPHLRSGNHIVGGRYVIAGPAKRFWQAGSEIDICDLARLFLAAASASRVAAA